MPVATRYELGIAPEHFHSDAFVPRRVSPPEFPVSRYQYLVITLCSLAGFRPAAAPRAVCSEGATPRRRMPKWTSQMIAKWTTRHRGQLSTIELRCRRVPEMDYAVLCW
jgi:hypothetical protein